MGAVVLCTSSGFSAYFFTPNLDNSASCVIYLDSENTLKANYFTRQKIMHGLFGDHEARGPLSKTALDWCASAGKDVRDCDV